MARYTPNSASTISEVNQEFEKIEQAIDDTLHRKGSDSNSMERTLDMNSERIINLPEAVSAKEPCTFGQFQSGIDYSKLPKDAEVLDSLVSLADTDTSKVTTVWTKGFYPNTTVGGGQFTLKTVDLSDNNGGTVISIEALQAWKDAAVAAGGVTTENLQANLNILFTAGTGTGDAFVRIHSIPFATQEIKPEWFGSVGDGLTDDTISIQKTFNQNADIKLSVGTYLCGRITLDEDRANGDIVIRGMGAKKSIIKSTSVSESIDTTPLGTAFLGDVILEDFSVDGNENATEFKIYKCVNVHMKNFYCYDHTAKNFYVLRSYQVSGSGCNFTTNNTLTPECAAYLATNATNFDGATYFNTQQKAPAVILALNEVGAPDCFNHTFFTCVFENCTRAVKTIDNIDTSSINLLYCYFELLENTSIPLEVVGGEHKSINVIGNHVGSSCEAIALIDQVSDNSNILISGNSLFRPVLLKTASAALGYFNIYDLPSIKMEHQNKDFQNPTHVFDFTPSIIVDDNYAFRELSVSKVRNALNEGYNLIKGSFYIRSEIDTPKTLLPIRLRPDGGTTYAFGFTSSMKISWRPYTKAVTGVNSFQIDYHKLDLVANSRGAGTEKESNTVTTLSAETAALSSITIVKNGANESIDVTGTGDASLPQSEWFLDFEIQAMR